MTAIKKERIKWCNPIHAKGKKGNIRKVGKMSMVSWYKYIFELDMARNPVLVLEVKIKRLLGFGEENNGAKGRCAYGKQERKSPQISRRS